VGAVNIDALIATERARDVVVSQESRRTCQAAIAPGCGYAYDERRSEVIIIGRGSTRENLAISCSVDLVKGVL